MNHLLPLVLQKLAGNSLVLRLALPVASVLLALVGIPLGAVSRKTGRGAAFVVTVFLAFLYYMSLVSLIGMSQSGRLSPELAAWGPNVLFGLIGLALVAGIDRPGDRDYLSLASAPCGTVSGPS